MRFKCHSTANFSISNQVGINQQFKEMGSKKKHFTGASARRKQHLRRICQFKHIVRPITFTDCRICLTPGADRSRLEILPEQRALYKLLTGFEILDSDISILICSSCNKFFSKLFEFQDKAVKIEQNIKEGFTRGGSLNQPVEPTLNDKEQDIKQEKSEAMHTIKCETEAEHITVKVEVEDYQLQDCQAPSSSMMDMESSTSAASDTNTNSFFGIIYEEQTKPEDKFENKISECSKCKNTFETSIQYVNHVCEKASRQGGVRSRVCHLCGKVFNRNLALESHLGRFHYEELNMPVFQCEHCGTKFGLRRLLNAHIRKRHTVNICGFCGRKVSKAKRSKRLLVNNFILCLVPVNHGIPGSFSIKTRKTK